MVSRIDTSLANTNTVPEILIAFRLHESESKYSSLKFKPKSNIVHIRRIQIPLYKHRIPNRISSFSDESKYRASRNPLLNRIQLKMWFYIWFSNYSHLCNIPNSPVFPDRLKKSLGAKIGKIKDHNYNDLTYMNE